MALLYILEYAVTVLILLIIFTQILIPIYRGTQLFPFFRRERNLENRLQSVKQDVLEAELEVQVLETKKRVSEMKKQER